MLNNIEWNDATPKRKSKKEQSNSGCKYNGQNVG